jgi:hypothetical protein
MKKNQNYIYLLIISLIFIGCGTAHYFIPHRPLEKGETMKIISWHYDFSGINYTDLLPQFSFYAGAGNGFNTGVGLQLPYYICNISGCKYIKTGDHQYLAVSAILNQLFAANNNPYFELNGGYIWKTGEFHHSIWGGMAYGTGATYPLVGRIKPSAAIWYRGHFLPTFKYSAVGNNGGMSLIYYHHFTSMGLDKLTKIVAEDNPVIYSLPAGSVDSLVTLKGIRPYMGEVYALFLHSGDTAFLGHPFRDFMFIPPLPPELQLDRIMNRRYKLYAISPAEEPKVAVDIEELRGMILRKETIAFRRYPAQLADTLATIKAAKAGWWHNLSIGVGHIDLEGKR